MLSRALPIALTLALLAGYEIAFAEPPPPTITVGTAWEAADALFSRHFGCGFIQGMRDAGGYWAFDAKVGYAGDVDPNPILVDKKTGTASWPGHEGTPTPFHP